MAAGPDAGARLHRAAPARGGRRPDHAHPTIRPPDNGYKVFVEGGMQINSPTDREIEAAVARAPHADEINRAAVETSGRQQVYRLPGTGRAGAPRHRFRCAWR